MSVKTHPVISPCESLPPAAEVHVCLHAWKRIKGRKLSLQRYDPRHACVLSFGSMSIDYITRGDDNNLKIRSLSGNIERHVPGDDGNNVVHLKCNLHYKIVIRK